MNKPVLLVPITIQFAVRYLLRSGLLSSFQSFATPVVVLGWEDHALREELRNYGIKTFQAPKVNIGRDYYRTRKILHHHHFNLIKSPSTSIDRRRDNVSRSLTGRIRNWLQRRYCSVYLSLPGQVDKLHTLERDLLHKDSNYAEFLKLVREIEPEGLFCITPYYIEEEFIVRACEELGVRTCTSILSFDNLTTRPRIPILFDTTLLWNQYNRSELLRIYPHAREKNIEIVGAPQFDFYYDPSYLWDEHTWRNRLNIPQDRPVILFGAGPEMIAPVEPHIVAQIDQAIESNQIIGQPVVLLRLHPVDTYDRWEKVHLSAKNVIVDAPWQVGNESIGKTNVTRSDIEKLTSTLKYSQVHISTSSTMTIDGAIFDHPQIGPAYDDSKSRRYDRAIRELYLREHYLPITNSGGLQIAYSIDQLVEQINDGFKFPDRHHHERKSMIRTLCTYDDGKSTQRVTNAVRRFITFGE